MSEKLLEARETEDRDSASQTAPNCFIYHIFSIFGVFSKWIGKQSLSRFIGVLLGNTRELEIQITDREKQIEWLKERLSKTEEQLFGLQNSFLISKGMLPTSQANSNVSNTPQYTSSNPGTNLDLETGIDKLKDMYFHRPGEVDEALGDLLATGKPRDKEVVRRFALWVSELQIEDKENEGTVIQQ